MIDRRHDDHLLIGLEKDVADQSDTLDDAGDKRQPLPLDVPLMMGEHPVMDGREVIFRLNRVAKDGMLQTMTQSIEDLWADCKIHICHPQGLQVVTSPAWFQCLVHEITRTTPLNDRIEIVLHN